MRRNSTLSMPPRPSASFASSARRTFTSSAFRRRSSRCRCMRSTRSTQSDFEPTALPPSPVRALSRRGGGDARAPAPPLCPSSSRRRPGEPARTALGARPGEFARRSGVEARRGAAGGGPCWRSAARKPWSWPLMYACSDAAVSLSASTILAVVHVSARSVARFAAENCEYCATAISVLLNPSLPPRMRGQLCDAKGPEKNDVF